MKNRHLLLYKKHLIQTRNPHNMKLNENAYLLQKMVNLIDTKRTGSPNELSKKLGISRSQIYNEIDELNSLGVDIKYSRKLNSFVFQGDKKIFVREPIVIVGNKNLTEINGGSFQKNVSVLFSGRNDIILAYENSQKSKYHS